MPETINVTTPETLGSLSVPVAGDPRNAGPLKAIFQKLLNMMAGSLQVATPTGITAPFAGAAAPAGWLLANGQAVSRSDYAALFAVIGTTYGPGNNSTTFNLPDLRGRVAVGGGQGAGLTNRTRAETGGEETHALTIQEMPSHSHQGPTPANATPGSFEVPALRDGGFGYANIDYAGAAPTDVTGGNAAHNVMQPFLVLNYIIRS